MTKLVLSSDWHGDVITQGVDRYPEVEDSVEESVTYAIYNEADAYFFCGDLTDPHTARSHRAVALAHKTAARLRDAGIPSYWLVGNHDVVEDGTGANTLMSLSSVATVMDSPRWFMMGRGNLLNVISLPFTPSSHRYDPVEFIEGLEIDNDFPILIPGHLNLQGITPGSETTDMPRGREVYWPMDAIRKKFPKAICIGGHYHERQVYDGVHIVGSIARLTYGEGDNDVGYLEVNI